MDKFLILIIVLVIFAFLFMRRVEPFETTKCRGYAHIDLFMKNEYEANNKTNKKNGV
jgi:hypothetical protein